MATAADAPGIRMMALGLDLGQSADYTAMALAERVALPGNEHEFRVRGVKRFPLRTPYPEIAREVDGILRKPEVVGASLIVDALGCGAPVVDMFRLMGLRPIAVKVHGGAQETHKSDGGEWQVPKRNLVSALVVAFQQDRMRIAGGTRHIEELKTELANYRMKVSQTGHDSYEAWREGDHDDLVFALGLAVWWLDRFAGPQELRRGSEGLTTVGLRW